MFLALLLTHLIRQEYNIIHKLSNNDPNELQTVYRRRQWTKHLRRRVLKPLSTVDFRSNFGIPGRDLKNACSRTYKNEIGSADSFGIDWCGIACERKRSTEEESSLRLRLCRWRHWQPVVRNFRRRTDNRRSIDRQLSEI